MKHLRGIFNRSSGIFNIFNKIFCRGANEFVQVIMSFKSVVSIKSNERTIGTKCKPIITSPILCCAFMKKVQHLQTF